MREELKPHRPTHGWTKRGHAVHAQTLDHLPEETRYQRFNKRVAIWLTKNVGSMTCYWIFTVITFVSFPAVIVTVVAGLTGVFPHWLIAAGLIALIQWVSSNYLQLTLLPAIMVGQNLQTEASDVRATKTFEDVETVLDRLDEHTEGGIKAILDRLDRLETKSN